MTRKWDEKLGQWRDSGKFGGNDNAAAAAGFKALIPVNPKGAQKLPPTPEGWDLEVYHEVQSGAISYNRGSAINDMRQAEKAATTVLAKFNIEPTDEYALEQLAFEMGESVEYETALTALTDVAQPGADPETAAAAVLEQYKVERTDETAIQQLCFELGEAVPYERGLRAHVTHSRAQVL